MFTLPVCINVVYGIDQEYLALNKQTNKRNKRVSRGSWRKRGQWNEAISVLLMTNPHANCANQSQQLEEEPYSNVKSRGSALILT